MGDSVDEQRRLDNELANITNTLLEQHMRTTTTSTELQDLEPVVYDLEQLIQPDVPPTDAFRSRLRQRLVEEWNLLRGHRSMRRFNPRPGQLVALAAAVAVILAVTAVLLNNTATGSLEGTATGTTTIVVLLTLTVVGAVAWYILGRNR